MEKNLSENIEKALGIISHVRGNPLSLDERKNYTVELAELILRESNITMTASEKREQEELSRLMDDPIGKAFTTKMTDECFRTRSKKRVANQMVYLLESLGIPRYLSYFKRFQLSSFKFCGKVFYPILVPMAMFTLRKKTSSVILPGEEKALNAHIQKREKEGVRLNLNHLGEAILSETEAESRTRIYLASLDNPHVNYVSIKISTIFSQINLLANEYSLEGIARRLRRLYQAAIKNPYIYPDGKKEPKFVNLDMEEYRDLHLTVEVFKRVLSEPEFLHYPAGIVLQAYIPDSLEIQKDLTEWAKERQKNGGAPIKIRIVKGANLANEQVEASLETWPQAPYRTKQDVDSNYKRMLTFGMIPENARAVHLGIASHNVFDIAFAILLRAEYEVDSYAIFEMLEGMADHIRRVVQKLTGDILLYCPVATKKDFQHAIAYLIRRLDENTGPENFLRHIFGLKPGTSSWDDQVALFKRSCDNIEEVADQPRKHQDRNILPEKQDSNLPFENESNTDFSLPQNRKWAEGIIQEYSNHPSENIPLVINGQEIGSNFDGVGINPSNPKDPAYRYALATPEDVENTIKIAKEAENGWKSRSIEEKSDLFAKAAQILRERRREFLGIMMVDGGKILTESDPEISEGIDFLEYYRHEITNLYKHEDLKWEAKGTTLVTPPWNFPFAIPLGGIAAALIAGNCVIFKPAPEAVLVGWHAVNALWDAGIPKNVLQFINCNDDPEGSLLIKDERINTVILTGATSTAKLFMKMKPGIDLAAETGGKNAMIISALSDRDLAIKSLIQSAFGHTGQKCSATSLAILEKEVYDDPHFLNQLRDAASSMKVGVAHDLSTKIGPIINPPNDTLKKGLTELDEGERWLLTPKPDPENPYLWTPGIRVNVKPGNFVQKSELFGPVLGIIRAENLDQAIDIANSTEYGLTSGLQSLDDREHLKWIQNIEAGNCYINRTTTGAIVRRQPFGGCKNSSFGGGSKAGGPNYLRELLSVHQESLPQEKHPLSEPINSLSHFIEKLPLEEEKLGLWYASISNYSYWWNEMKEMQDPSKLVGQDNFFYYVPRKGITLRIDSNDDPLDVLRIIAAAVTCSTPIEVSFMEAKEREIHWPELVPLLRTVNETESEFLDRVGKGHIKRVRIISPPTEKLTMAAANSGTHIVAEKPLANGRFELLHYLREVSLSIDYHRYGNLGLRESELRKPIF